MKSRICLAFLIMAGIALSGGCDGSTGTAEAEAPADGVYSARTDYSLIPNDGLSVMERELSRREEQIVSGEKNRLDNTAETAELKNIRAEKTAIQEEMARRR